MDVNKFCDALTPILNKYGLEKKFTNFIKGLSAERGGCNKNNATSCVWIGLRKM